MRHKIAFRRLGRPTAHRLALLRNQVAALIEHGEIITTLPKAKETRRMAEKMVTLAKKGSIHHQRQAQAILYGPESVDKLWKVWGPIFQERPGGYTRIERLRERRGDGAVLARLSFCQEPYEHDPVKRRRNRLVRQKLRYSTTGVLDEPPPSPKKVLEAREAWLKQIPSETQPWQPKHRKPKEIR